MKKALSILLTVVMLFSITPLGGLARLGFAPIVKAENTSYQVGDIIELGEYPQSQVTDSQIIATLDDIEKTWISYKYYSGTGTYIDGQMKQGDWMRFSDITLNNNRFRAVTIDTYRPYNTGLRWLKNYQETNGYGTHHTYYFKYEPLCWKILNPSSGLIVCDKIIDSQAYQNTMYYNQLDGEYWQSSDLLISANNYSESSIRYWLLNDFYEIAFNNLYVSRNNQSTDAVFLLSLDDISDFVFNNEIDFSYCAKGTDYAKSQGLFNKDIYGHTCYEYSPWWLRTQGTHSCWATVIDNNGLIRNDDWPVNDTSNGIRPAMYVDLDSISNQIMNDEYISTHTIFASATTMPENFGFYNKVWNEENGKRLGWVKTWEVVGDLGELMTFKFGDLEITADYYKLFLSDIILKLTEQRAAEFELKAFDLFQEYHGKIKKALKSTAEWEESVTDGSTVDLEIDSILLDPDFECSGNTATVFSTLLGKFYQNHQDTFTEIFAGLDNAAAICEAITDVADIGKAFTEAYKAYTVTMAYQQVSTQFFTVMYQAAERMGNRQYANWFKRALNQYFALATSGDALFEASLQLCKEMTDMAFDRIAKDVVKNLAYQTVADLIGCAAGPVAIAAFTYSATYGLLDKICGLDKRTKAYEIMTYIAPVEQALCALEDDYAAVLIGSQTLESAQNYDYFYNLYKQVNLYLYLAAYDFRSAAWLSKSKKEEMEIFSMCMDQWKRSSCHTGLSAATVRKYSSVCCPVDVYAYDANGETVLEIVNDEILLCDDSITALTFDGKKSIVYPADQNYSIRIVARESGSMDYSVSEIQGDSSVRQIDYYDIPLAEAQTFNGAVPSAFNVAADAYALTTNEAAISCDYDSSESPCVDMHTVTEWTETAAATCAMPGEKRGVCAACGKQVFETLPVSETHGATILKNAADATCQTDGYTGDEVCSVCGETLQTGAIVEKETVAHRWNDGAITVPATCTAAGERTFTCTVCETEKTEPVAPLAHPDEDKDGWCDACGEELYSHTQTDTSGEKCKYCDTVHPNTFMGRITKFFHSILYFFTHLFGNK